MKKIIFNLLLLALLLTGCSAPNVLISLRPTGSIEKKLPQLEPFVYTNSLENTFSKGTSQTYGNISGGIISTISAVNISYADKRVNDAIVMFESDVKDNICNYVGTKKGTISLKILNSNIAYKRAGLKWLGLSLGTSALLALPILNYLEKENRSEGAITLAIIPSLPILIYPAILKNKATQTLDIEVEIKNNKGDVVGRYIGSGTGINQQTIYNFAKVDILRIISAEALEIALQDVKNKISSDTDNLLKALE